MGSFRSNETVLSYWGSDCKNRTSSRMSCFSYVLFPIPLSAKNKKDIRMDVLFVVREAGVEPARPCEHWHLKPASLPIPPLARGLECTVCSVYEIYYHILPPVSTLFFLHRPFFLFLTLFHRERHRFVRFHFPIYYILISTKSAFFTLSSPIFARSSQKKFSKKLLFVKIPH